MLKRILVFVGILLVAAASAGGGYLYGVSVGEARATQARQQLAAGRSVARGELPVDSGLAQQRGLRGGSLRGDGVVGAIEAIEGDVLVVDMDGKTMRVITTDTTLIEKLAVVELQDLAVGEQVVVTGTDNEDGSVTARSIQSLRGIGLASQGAP